MPKPRTARREHRRFGRDIARIRLAKAIEHAIVEPLTGIDSPDVMAAYQAELRRAWKNLSRAHARKSPVVLGDRGVVAGSEPGESGA